MTSAVTSIVRSCAGFLLAALLAGGACNPSPAKESKDAGCVDGGDAACAPRCEQSVADYCAAAGSCVMDWPADPGTFCSSYPPNGQPGLLDYLVSEDCGPYRVFRSQSVDTWVSLYYGKATGKLLAVVGHYNVLVRCLAGPPGFVEPSCDTPQDLACGDAGADAGTEAAAGSGGG